MRGSKPACTMEVYNTRGLGYSRLPNASKAYGAQRVSPSELAGLQESTLGVAFRTGGIKMALTRWGCRWAGLSHGHSATLDPQSLPSYYHRFFQICKLQWGTNSIVASYSSRRSHIRRLQHRRDRLISVWNFSVMVRLTHATALLNIHFKFSCDRLGRNVPSFPKISRCYVWSTLRRSFPCRLWTYSRVHRCQPSWITQISA